MTEKQDFKVNFFKPLSDHARANMKIIISLVIIWAVCVFGFQILLIILNNPTPEKSYTQFEKLWPGVVDNDQVSVDSKQQFARTILSVLGKNIAVKDDHKAVLKKVLSWSVYSMLSDSVKAVFTSDPNDEALIIAQEKIGLESAGFDKIMVDLLPSSLIQVDSEHLCDNCKAELPKIMKLYLVHNQSALTNFKFIGFPFHYWYTAQFLLILFVILCLIYAVMIDRINKKHNFVEES